MSLTAQNRGFALDHIDPFLDESMSRNHLTELRDHHGNTEDDVNLEALITDLHCSFPKDDKVLLGSEMSLIDAAAYAEIKPYEYTIHDLRRTQTDAQKRNMSLPVQGPGSNNALPNPFPELEKTPIINPSTEAAILQGSRTAPASPAVQVRVKKGSLTPPMARNKNNAFRMPVPDSNWGAQLIQKAGERKTSESRRRICLNFYSDDSTNESYKTLVINENLTASDISHLLILKNNVVPDKNWVIVEHLHQMNMDRSLEDHELVLRIHDSWGTKTMNKFIFRKDFKKYELFQNPTLYFPSQMTGSKEDQGILSEKSERQKQILLQNLMSSTDRLPDLQGYLHMKEAGKKSWKKAFFVLRGSGLYYSNKGTSKDPKHLVTFCQFLDIGVFIANSAKKTFHSPTPFTLCFKPDNVATLEPKEMKCLCAEDEKNRMCWLAGIRLAKYGKQLQENYRTSLRRQDKLHNINNGSPPNTDGSDPKERVAMDFTGVNGGRVVDDPNEAIGVAIQEGHQWRKKITRPMALASSPSGRGPSNLSPSVSRRMVSSTSLNMMQPWFHHGVSRDEANELIAKQGLADGVFLIRESRMMTGSYVLSVAHNLRVKHFQVSPVEENGSLYYSLDGNIKFGDLIQLVDFYQLNAGGLPVKLVHYVSRLA